MTIWLDQFLIGILIGALLSAAIDATETETAVAQTAATTVFRNDLDFSAFMSSLPLYVGCARVAPGLL
jgi:hypothetical protein